MGDALFVFLIFGGPGLLLGLLLGIFVGDWGRRFVALSLVGVALVLVFFVAAALTTDLDACHDCYPFPGGRAFSMTEFVLTLFNGAGWSGGVALGTWVRKRRTASEAAPV